MKAVGKYDETRSKGASWWKEMGKITLLQPGDLFFNFYFIVTICQEP